MTDIDLSETSAASGAFGLLATWSGAAMSAALIGGLVVWGWQLTIRDVSGVPVIRALEGPMRTAPQAPGGERASHQGLAVNRVAEDATDPPPQQVVLAPAEPDLAEEDLALAPPAAIESATARALPASGGSREPVRALAATDLAVAEALGLAGDAVLVLASARSGASDVPATTAGWLRPEPRPAPIRASLSGAGVAATQEVPLAALETGAQLVQLGAFETADAARAAWDELAGRFDGYFFGKHRVVQPASSAGRAFWRLRAAGFEDLADARRFCSALTARQAECIPAVVR